VTVSQARSHHSLIFKEEYHMTHSLIFKEECHMTFGLHNLKGEKMIIFIVMKCRRNV